MPIRPLKNKKYQADIANSRRGLKRTKRTFKTRAQAKEWLEAVERDTHDRLLGHRPARLFGEALAKFLEEEGQDHELVKTARTLRWPVRIDGHWVRLEQQPIEEIVPALNTWMAEMRCVKKRSYLGGGTYHLRGENGIDVWYQQPEPTEGAEPQPRQLVDDSATIEQLNAARGRGPYAVQSLRVRQVLVRLVLQRAWKTWDWLEHDLSGKIELLKPKKGEKVFLLPDPLDALIAKTRQLGKPWLARAICAASWIGWRRSNILRLEWDRVVFPKENAGSPLLRRGFYWVTGDQTKNEEDLAQPMSERTLALFRECWEHRDGPYVFHKDGKCLADIDFRKAWKRALRESGIKNGFRWHSLRHTWASHLGINNVPDGQIQTAGGWKTPTMVKRYAHLNVEHLQDLVDAYKGDQRAVG